VAWPAVSPRNSYPSVVAEIERCVLNISSPLSRTPLYTVEIGLDKRFASYIGMDWWICNCF